MSPTDDFRLASVPARSLGGRAPTVPVGTVRPALIIGVTGHMAIPPDSVQAVRKRVTALLQWLVDGPWPGAADRCCQVPLGLKQTPIQLLTSLAPGADQMVAEEALALDYQVRCPLPFPAAFYREASTFRRGSKGSDGSVPIVTAEDDEVNTPPARWEGGLPVPTAEDDGRRETFDALVARIGPENAFFVWRAEDLELAPAELERRLAADRLDSVRRNLRYRAAGEYVSGYCDILIAICDQESAEDEPEEQPGLPPLAQPSTGFIVRSHLQGMDPGILPLGTTLTWADNGPVIRIFCPNARKVDPGSKTCAEVERIPLAVWHPRDSAVPEEFDPHWHERQMNNLRIFAGRLEQLNNELAAAPQPEPGQSTEMLGRTTPYRPKTWVDDLAAPARKMRKKVAGRFRKQRRGLVSPPPRVPTLERIAALRWLVDNLSYLYDDQVRALTGRLFLLSFAVVVALQLSENWVTGNSSDPLPPWRIWIFALGLVLFASGFLYHGMKRRKGIFDRQNDYRALAEGLRVQFYWSAAGLGHSAASNYLQRARGELSWIRAAIASAAFPYESERRAFMALPDPEKYERLSMVCDGWLGNQESYFSKSTHEQSRRNQRLHTSANLCLIAAFVLMLANFAQYAMLGSPALERWRGYALQHAFCPIWLWLGGAAGIWLGVQWVTSRAYRAYYDEARLTRWVKISRFLSHFHNPIWLWLGGLTLGWSIFWTIQRPPVSPGFPLPSPLPSPLQLGLIAKNLLLAAGGLIHTYAAFKFATENTRRYAAMRDLFRATEIKVRTQLEAFRLQIADPATGPEEKAHSVLAIQTHLAALGREALQENTDWFQMQRNKPMEPVLPAG